MNPTAATSRSTGSADTSARPEAPAYRVFLSYSHTDAASAGWLLRRLENFRVPARLQGRLAPIGVVGPRIAPVFRDREELPTTSDLGATIRTALAASATLVVICSPAAARSRWVQAEITDFKRLHGVSRVFALIVDGEPREGADNDCFPPALRTGTSDDDAQSDRPAEIAAADARPHADGRDGAFLRLVAGLLGVGFDELRQRELQRRHRRMTLITAASVCGMTITLGLAALAWQARNDAQRRQEQAEDLLGFMVSDLRVPLAKLNKLDILDAVGVKAMAYFAALNPRDLTDTALRRQAEALRQVGENRKDQARYPEALQSLQAAYESAKVLAARQPRNGDFLFERGQAEFWIGFVLRRLGRTKEMTEWLTRYRDTGAALVALNPDEPRWQEELASGHHNLAVLDTDEERLDAARRGFLGALAMLTRLSAAKPNDLELQFRIADANSWLGNVAEMSGDLTEAARRFADQVARTEAILRAEPDNATFKRRLADALSLHAGILALTGQRKQSMEPRLRAIALFESLASGDPRNQSWQRLLFWGRLRLAELLRAEGDLAAATTLADELRGVFEKLSAAEPNDNRIMDRLAFVCRLQAELRVDRGDPQAATPAARAVEIAERLVATRPTFAFISECALARVAAGRIARRDGQPEAAHQHWRRAIELLQPRLSGSSHWRILLPAAHAYWHLGETETSRALIARLQRLGFQPLEPWPTTATSASPSPQLKP
ncbi:TIR domain-containing protein [Horticoccus sp. 23ND18S-11]|uniref:TIR domain-containing protein n=1 Tax=Horticoccus sp. 23ND18S-11 TaxID=3391832 RepID=UPI0039C93BD0